MPLKDPDARRAYDRARNVGARRERGNASIRQWNLDNPERAKAARDRYGATKAGKAAQAKAHAKYDATPQRQASKKVALARHRATAKCAETTAAREARPERKAQKRRAVSTRRARVMEAFDEIVDIDVLGERDGWVCGICGEPVDQDLRHPDSMSKSHDHIIPLSKGGRHLYTNSQLAHLRCNLRKSATVELKGAHEYPEAHLPDGSGGHDRRG